MIFSRKDKMGFPVPLSQWFRGSLHEFVGDIMLSQRARQRGIYQMDGVENLILKEQKFGRQLWGLLCMELWHRAFIDGDYIQPLAEEAPLTVAAVAVESD